jgi:hypothetical protein
MFINQIKYFARNILKKINDSSSLLEPIGFAQHRNGVVLSTHTQTRIANLILLKILIHISTASESY